MRILRRLQLILILALPFVLGKQTASASVCGYNGVRFLMPETSDSIVQKGKELFIRIAEEHAGRILSKAGGRVLTIELNPSDKSLPSEGFRIAGGGSDFIQIFAGDSNGILYGLGKLLHGSHFEKGRFVPVFTEEPSIPDKKLRGIYFATHFNNFYHSAPEEEVVRYIEELALWGYNHLQVWFDMHHFTSADDPEAIKMRKRLARFLRAGKSVGMKSGLTMLANEGYSTTPEHLRAHKVDFTDFFGVEICPSVPGGSELILRQVEENIDAFAALDVKIDHIQLWPYDQGGCTCEKCTPWGGNGYLKITHKLSDLIRRKLPDVSLTLSTWLFDFKEQDKGEWHALGKAFENATPWVDYIMADSHTTFPGYLLNNPVPGGLGLLNFPEISMWGNFPWGGYGANPQPKRFQKLWNDVSDKIVGGYPYSEGIYEDANKVIYSQFYWNRECHAMDALREYVAFEFSPIYADRIMEAIELLENNYGMSSHKWGIGDYDRIKLKSKATSTGEARRILENVDEKLPQHIRVSWRWRLLLLRSRLDDSLFRNDGKIDNAANEAFGEIEKIQHLENAHFYVHPPVRFGEAYPIKKIH